MATAISPINTDIPLPQGAVVYMLLCSDDTLYTGSTNDLHRRFQEHNHAKTGAHYTKIRRPVHLVYYEAVADLSLARKREYAIKQLTRKEKELLIAQFSR